MLPWALLVLFILFLVVAYIVIQGTRAAMAWRKAAESGDLHVIRDIVQDAITTWSGQRRPKEVSPEVWRGVQSMQLLGVAADFVHVSLTADSEYRMDGGRWIEIRNPLQEGKAITARAAEMLFYELPHYRPERIQVDVYTQYRDDEGVTRMECILSTAADRDAARRIDWDEWPAETTVQELGGAFRVSETGRPVPIAPITPPAEAQSLADLAAAEAKP
jgi:hypothetical protein